MAAPVEVIDVTNEERNRWDDRYRARTRGDRSPGDPSPILEAAVDGHPPGRALDVATGGGRNARYLAAHGWTVDGLDISRIVLERARARARADGVSANWILADADRYGFPPTMYDLVTISFFDARRSLPEILEALTPGGILVYEHYVVSGDSGDSSASTSGPGDRYRFQPGELLERCRSHGIRIQIYDEYERRDETRVILVGRRSG
ncbi:class I SAM-dependent methyltransferase [Natronosalvus vescus]|uniref:class I SAM-dependent methyltransferase n=1 Tax=Natronosalvus vescus TaxID=2953881 RepID=UPI0020903E5B|nr:class I SAM-dependent methyltransferase [Natronosalvus vescus]